MVISFQSMCGGTCASYKDKLHWQCCMRPKCGKLFWLVALIALILAWVATFKGTVWGLDAMHWYWDALVLGVLALGLKMASHRGCGHVAKDGCGGGEGGCGGACRGECKEGEKCAGCGGEGECKCGV